jgi:hypothetical protein
VQKSSLWQEKFEETDKIRIQLGNDFQQCDLLLKEKEASNADLRRQIATLEENKTLKDQVL